MRLLLIDTCGETGSLALLDQGKRVGERTFAARTASAELVVAIGEELATAAWPLQSLAAVGVVNGPGSFTGVRVGLAAAKGICEIGGLPLITVSRLAVMLAISAKATSAIAVLDAGRGEVYVRHAGDEEELLLGVEDLRRTAAPAQLVVAEERLANAFCDVSPERIELRARHAWKLVEEKLATGACDDVALVDVNYVRAGASLYASGAATR